MQRAFFQQATITQIQIPVNRALPGHGTGVEDPAINDDVYQVEISPIRMVFSVLANVIGGTLLLTAMFYLPHIIGSLLS
jgi:hypothetical protein